MQALRERVLSILKSSASAKSPEAEAEQILFHVARMSNHSLQKPSDLSTHSAPLGMSEVLEAIHIAENRAQGVPLQHLLGYQFFYSHEYAVDSSTLIPRPETEILIDEAIRHLQDSSVHETFRFAELGLGSGILSCELLSHFSRSSGVASELQPAAIELARKNLHTIIGSDFDTRLEILRVNESTLGFEIFLDHGPFDLILSNPPYLSPGDEVEGEVRSHEPHSALFPMRKAEPLEASFFYRNFIEHAPHLLRPGAAVFFEVPHERALEILRLFETSGFTAPRLVQDLTGKPRVLAAKWGSP